MCEAYPGLRCASHTHAEALSAKKALDAAKKDLRQARSVDEREEAKQSILRCEDKYRKSLVEYYGTPTGEKKLRDEISRKEAQGANADTARGLLTMALKHREERKNLARHAHRDMLSNKKINTSVKALRDRTVVFSSHSKDQMKVKGFKAQDVAALLQNPDEVYPSRSHEGQWRVTGKGICLVGEPKGGEFVVITMYQDRVLTPVRSDQLNTPEGRLYAERMRQGLGRGGGRPVPVAA